MKRSRVALSFAVVASLVLVAARGVAEERMEVLPFHSEIVWDRLDQEPIPEGRCTAPLPSGLSYLWLSKEYGTATTAHLGTGPYYAEFCVYGILSNPELPPPGNGTPMGFNAIELTWTAANGDTLKATAELIGVMTNPALAFVCAVSFQDGGTGRFAHAHGTVTGLVYPDPENPQAGREVHDGWFRYRRARHGHGR
jgi:hypothetical protein